MKTKWSEDVLHKSAACVRLLVLDLDGVLTDGKIYYGHNGDEMKCFNIQDGYGLVLARKQGLEIAIISGKKSKVNERRAKELGITHLYQNIVDKDKTLDRLAKKLKVDYGEICYIGDDIIDISAMQMVGFSVAVSDAVDSVLSVANVVTTRCGGSGAVREIVDLILKAQGKAPRVKV